TPALTPILKISTDYACDSVGQHTPVDLRSPQSLLLSSTIDGTGPCSQDLPAHQPASNRHRARRSRVLCLPRLRALQVCRRRPTLRVAAVPHGRHPQTFTTADSCTAAKALHSMTLSARERIAGGTVMSSTFAVFIFIMKSNLVV